jgi:N-acetylglutamate synthase-like GNAT family acetyltransferase
MHTVEQLSIDHDDRAAIYEYLDRSGPRPPEAVRERLGIDPRGFKHHVAILKRDGHVEEVDGDLRASVETGGHEQFRENGFEFTIRPAREADLSGLVGVIRQVASEQTYIEAESVADVLDHEGTILRQDEVESRMFFVATVDDEVVGWVHLHCPELTKLAHTAELTLGVLEGYRGHGVGPRLLDRALRWADGQGLERLYQSAPATNEQAIEFLKREGWRTEAVREDHYRIDGAYVDEVMMDYHL